LNQEIREPGDDHLAVALDAQRSGHAPGISDRGEDHSGFTEAGVRCSIRQVPNGREATVHGALRTTGLGVPRTDCRDLAIQFNAHGVRTRAAAIEGGRHETGRAKAGVKVPARTVPSYGERHAVGCGAKSACNHDARVWLDRRCVRLGAGLRVGHCLAKCSKCGVEIAGWKESSERKRALVATH